MPPCTPVLLTHPAPTHSVHPRPQLVGVSINGTGRYLFIQYLTTTPTPTASSGLFMTLAPSPTTNLIMAFYCTASSTFSIAQYPTVSLEPPSSNTTCVVHACQAASARVGNQVARLDESRHLLKAV